MGLFDLFKTKEKPKGYNKSKILLAMPMFTNSARYKLDAVVENLKNYWDLNISSVDGNDETAVLTINGENVAIAYIPAPIPMGDIEGSAQYAYNWTTILDDLKDFTGHSIVSIMAGQKPTLERFKLLSKVLQSILTTSNAIGIYQGSQSLLIPRDQYIKSAEELKEDGLPIDLWIYLGIRKSDEGISIYTYGLTEFGKSEIEIINSKLGLDELFGFIVNICAYVIGSNVTFKNGETLGYTADQKVKLTHSKGQFVDGESLKLEM